jgi:hypothetical protein
MGGGGRGGGGPEEGEVHTCVLWIGLRPDDLQDTAHSKPTGGFPEAYKILSTGNR